MIDDPKYWEAQYRAQKERAETYWNRLDRAHRVIDLYVRPEIAKDLHHYISTGTPAVLPTDVEAS